MKPIVLIHGYSAESESATRAAVEKIYGSLPRRLKRTYGAEAVVDIDLSRYISLEDGISLDDVSRALDRALHETSRNLLSRRFHAIVHSTGALVIRNWIRRFSAKPSKLQNLIHLAGANFGSGWAHLGKGQLAKWGRAVLQPGTERGIQILGALELGTSWTIDLHRHFLQQGTRMREDYGVNEYVIVGTQAEAKWFIHPVRYSHEDGSDGVVRVAASNLNFNYLRLEPTAAAKGLTWSQARRERDAHIRRRGIRRVWYDTLSQGEVPEIPFAIPHQCAHSGGKMGILSGSKPQEQVFRLLRIALESRPGQYERCVDRFNRETAWTYQRAKSEQAPSRWRAWLAEPRAQYDAHTQVVFRIRDQDGRPVEHHDVFFDSVPQRGSDRPLSIKDLVEHTHVNHQSPNIITFYLRTDKWSGQGWEDQISKVADSFLEITATELQTEEIVYLPLRFELDAAILKQFVQPHRTTVIDVELLRLPSGNVFRLVRYS